MSHHSVGHVLWINDQLADFLGPDHPVAMTQFLAAAQAFAKGSHAPSVVVRLEALRCRERILGKSGPSQLGNPLRHNRAFVSTVVAGAPVGRSPGGTALIVVAVGQQCRPPSVRAADVGHEAAFGVAVGQ